MITLTNLTCAFGRKSWKQINHRILLQRRRQGPRRTPSWRKRSWTVLKASYVSWRWSLPVFDPKAVGFCSREPSTARFWQQPAINKSAVDLPLAWRTDWVCFQDCVFLVELASAQLHIPSVLHQPRYVQCVCLLENGALKDKSVVTRNSGRCHPWKARAPQKAGTSIYLFKPIIWVFIASRKPNTAKR